MSSAPLKQVPLGTEVLRLGVLRIIWELRGRPLTFRMLQSACGGLSPSVLNQRLSALRETALVELRPDEGYGLTALGRELLAKFVPLAQWAEKWAKAFRSPKP